MYLQNIYYACTFMFIRIANTDVEGTRRLLTDMFRILFVVCFWCFLIRCAQQRSHVSGGRSL